MPKREKKKKTKAAEPDRSVVAQSPLAMFGILVLRNGSGCGDLEALWAALHPGFGPTDRSHRPQGLPTCLWEVLLRP